MVKGRSISNKIFYSWIIGAWVFVYLLGIITVVLHDDVYVRAGAWVSLAVESSAQILIDQCWVNRQYESERLWLHYFWIFVCMFGTIVIYALMYVRFFTFRVLLISISYLSIYRRAASFDTITTQSGASDPAVLKRASKYMIIFPVVYVCCTLPLAAGRMAAMTGMVIPYWWFCVAGAAITSNGWLDVMLYVMTRRVLVGQLSGAA